MKTINARGTYTVSFNIEIGDYEVGDSGMNSIDYAGDDIDQLAQEVVAGDPSFPLVFERVDAGRIIGVFRNVEEDIDDVYVVAVMYK
jgi:hypothetical protein